MKKETRTQRIRRYKKLSKDDLLSLLICSQDAFDELLKALKGNKSFSIVRPR